LPASQIGTDCCGINRLASCSTVAPPTQREALAIKQAAEDLDVLGQPADPPIESQAEGSVLRRLVASPDPEHQSPGAQLLQGAGHFASSAGWRKAVAMTTLPICTRSVVTPMPVSNVQASGCGSNAPGGHS